jgi:hypothetical protein
MSRQSIPRQVFLSLVASLVACGPFRRGGPETRAYLIFKNESLDQATVYAVPQGTRAVRIGTVLAGRTDTLVVPTEVVGHAGTVNVIARMSPGSGTPQTGPIGIRPGDTVEVRLPVDEKLLSVVPWRSNR